MRLQVPDPSHEQSRSMTPEAVQVWLDAYAEAWRSYDAGAIGDLFAELA